MHSHISITDCDFFKKKTKKLFCAVVSTLGLWQKWGHNLPTLLNN